MYRTTTAKIILIDGPIKSGEWPIKLQIRKNKLNDRIPINKLIPELRWYCLPENWDKGACKFKSHPDKNLMNAKLAALYSQALDELKLIDQANPEASVYTTKELLFKALSADADMRLRGEGIRRPDISKEDILAKMDEFINLTTNKDTKKHFETSVAIFRRKYPRLLFSEVNRKLLDSFKKWAFETLNDRGQFRTKSTVRGYMRDMRRVWNWCIEVNKDNAENRKFLEEAYPFGKNVIPTIKRKERKKNITYTGRVMDYLIGYDATWGHKGERAKIRRLALDTILMQYGMMGMRISDALTLRKTELSTGRGGVVYDMGKTGEVKQFRLPDFVADIVNRYWSEPGHFVLPHFGTNENPSVEDIATRRDLVNRNMAFICKKIGIPKITTHGARRCAGRKMLEGNMNVVDIQLMYGHDDLSTTLDYIGAFDLVDIVGTDEKGNPIFGTLNEQSKMNEMVDVMNRKSV